ncbi:acyltransferase family protein [Bradyrhizobium cytisi]|uniref:acyltransferase family protein n=1 Tax=Bradyrhizobium cytisi TaxID=515489 RepID=UPI001FEBA5FB|nr:acyltransferase [Bradyrhizobium cytisi]
MFSHAFLIGDGSEAREPFVRLLGEGHILGIFGVFVFFIVSGFLVSQSLLTAPSTINYLWRRILRIYPALLVCLVLSAFIVGPLYHDDGPLHFLTSIHDIKQAVKYVLGNLFWPGRTHEIEAVTFYGEPTGWLGSLINGSLWTISYEVCCYVALALLKIARMFNVWTVGGISLAMCLVNALGFYPSRLADFLFVAPAFFAGAACYLISLQTQRPAILVAVVMLATVVLLIAAYEEMLLQIFPLAGAPLVLLLATTHAIRLPDLHRLGDISYGVYLYGWPVEQVVRSFVGPTPLVVFALSLPLACALGYVSWWVIEKPMLRYKRLIRSFHTLAREGSET